MPHREINGTRLHFQVIGRGTPIVLTHGLVVDNLSSWFFGAEPLSLTRRVILHDIRGHGMSDRCSTGFDLAALSSDLHGLMEALAPDEPVDLAGNSYGGVISLACAIRYPGRIRRLALIDPPLPPQPSEEIQSWMKADLWELWMSLPANIRRSLAPSPRRGKKFVEGVQFLAEQSTLIRDICNEPAFSDEEIRSVACPVLLLSGAQSHCRSDSLRLASLMPRARLKTFEAGHTVLCEHYSEVIQSMQEFLDEQ